MKKQIEIYNASQNNLKSVSVKIPLGSFTVICGLSGSGKSSLAFETLYAEGQRRYLQNLSNYLKQYIIQQSPPDVEKIINLPPALALEQKNNVKSSRSTVASLSGLSDHLRLIFEKLGQAQCPIHKTPLQSFSPNQITQYLLTHFEKERAFILIPILRDLISEPKVFLKALQAKGFSRVLIPKKNSLNLKQVKDINEIKRFPKKDFYLLLDRFVIEKKQKDRLRDSFKQAFEIPKMFPSYSFSKEAVVSILNGEVRSFSAKTQCPECSYKLPYPITANLFSFSSPLGACEACQGYGHVLDLDEKKVIPNPSLSIEKGAVYPFQSPSGMNYKRKLKQFCEDEGVSLKKAWQKLSVKERRLVWKGSSKSSFKGVVGFFNALESKKYKMHVRIFLSRYKSPFRCKVCRGSRLKSELNSITFKGKTFIDYMKMNLGQIDSFFDKKKISPEETAKVEEPLSALKNHLKYLNALGLSYLELNRYVKTLSGGEFQRLNLSSQLGLCLSQVLYVLDEPTVGLHPRDTARMIEILKELQKLGNTIVIVEHDPSVMKSSDYIIEMGPESGNKGGELLWSGSWDHFLNQEQSSNTVPYLKRKQTPFKEVRPVNKSHYKYRLLLKGCAGHNLKKVDLFMPLNRFVILTGVSGSGKSSLITQTLYPALKQQLTGEPYQALPYEKLLGAEFLKDSILMTQHETGRSSRSSVISYVKVFHVIRRAFANTALAQRLQRNASYFSLNVDGGGRCPICRGTGFQEVDMLFMDALKVECEECRGKKFKKDILDVRLKGKNIDDLLKMTVEEAFHFFRGGDASLLRAFHSLKEVGLDYLNLGQSLNSLSGGERQRLKLSRELLKSNQEKTLYILDEPTKGLHFKELDLLLKVVDQLVSTGASFLVIEHNLDFIKEADYVIDMGPEAGSKGGQILAEGSPLSITNKRRSHTGRFLKKAFEI